MSRKLLPRRTRDENYGMHQIPASSSNYVKPPPRIIFQPSNSTTGLNEGKNGYTRKTGLDKGSSLSFMVPQTSTQNPCHRLDYDGDRLSTLSTSYPSTTESSEGNLSISTISTFNSSESINSPRLYRSGNPIFQNGDSQGSLDAKPRKVKARGVSRATTKGFNLPPPASNISRRNSPLIPHRTPSTLASPAHRSSSHASTSITPSPLLAHPSGADIFTPRSTTGIDFHNIVLNRLVQFNVIRHYVETNLFPYYS